MSEKIIFSNEAGIKGYALGPHRFQSARIAREYDAIKSAVAEAVGSDNLIEGPFNWPRDFWTIFQTNSDQQFVVAEMDFYRNGFAPGLKLSKLGQGGAILNRRDLVLISDNPSLKRLETMRDINFLTSRGFRFVEVSDMGIYPAPELERYVSGHIDGPLSLLSNDKDEKLLIMAKSYLWNLRQRPDRADIFNRIRNEVNISIIDDSQIPPQALNMLQLEDNSVIMTSGAPSLEGLVSEFVSDKVVTTGIPILELSRLKGGIRCMTNVAPQDPRLQTLLIDSFRR